MKDFNLPGLFRYLHEMAKETGESHVSINVLIPECDKDEFIYAFTDTRFIEDYSPIQRAVVPCEMNLTLVHPAINVLIEASDALESGQMILEFR